MKIQVFDTFDGLRYLEVVKGRERVPIKTQEEFECVFFNYSYHAQVGVPKTAQSFDFADVAFVYQTLPANLSFDRNNLPLFVRVDEMPEDTSRLFFAFYFQSTRQVLLVGGIHVCFLPEKVIQTKTLLSLATKDIWLRKRSDFGTFYPIYHTVFRNLFPRDQLVSIVKWRLDLLVTGSESLISHLLSGLSELQKIQTALEWHKKAFSNYTETMRMMDMASFWSTMASSESFPPNLFSSYMRAEKWLLRIRSCLLCKSEKEFEALIQNELGEPLDLSELGFKPFGVKRRGEAGPSDPWFSLPLRCPERRFEPAYQKATRKSGRLCVRKSVLQSLNRPLLPFKVYPDPSSSFFNQEIFNVSKLVDQSVGSSSFADLGDLAVQKSSCQNVYETAFENAPKALSLRQGVLYKGQMVLPWFCAYEILQTRFEKRVAKSHRNGLLKRVFEDEENFLKASSSFVERVMVENRRQLALSSKPDYLPQIDQVEPFLPPCMKLILSKIVKEGKVFNNTRYTLIPFFFKVGYSYEAIRMFLESIWDPDDWVCGDVQKELPGLAKRFLEYEEASFETRRPFGNGCREIARSGFCPVSQRSPRKALSKLYNQPVVDIEDCAGKAAGEVCASVLRWQGGRTKFAICSPQNYLKQILKS